MILTLLTHCLTANGLFSKFQSGFRSYHFTELAVLRVLSDIYSAIDQDQVSLLALLDVSAAFDIVDHGILLERLSTSYGLMRYSVRMVGVLHHWPSTDHSTAVELTFLPTSDFSTTSINFSGRDSKLTIYNSPCYATEDRCQQCYNRILSCFFLFFGLSRVKLSDFSVCSMQLCTVRLRDSYAFPNILSPKTKLIPD